MFERFTEDARRVVVVAGDEARRLRHNYIGGEHLLLGLLAVEGVHRDVLSDYGVALNEAREHVQTIVGSGGEAVVTGQIPFTPRAKQALERALREALRMGHNHIAPYHVLLGLNVPTSGPGQDEGVARRLLREAGAEPELVEAAIRHRLVSAVDPRGPSAEAARGSSIRFEGAAPPRTAKRCEQAFTLYGALYVCQRENGHPNHHLEHGDGWTMCWDPE